MLVPGRLSKMWCQSWVFD